MNHWLWLASTSGNPTLFYSLRLQSDNSPNNYLYYFKCLYHRSEFSYKIRSTISFLSSASLTNHLLLHIYTPHFDFSWLFSRWRKRSGHSISVIFRSKYQLYYLVFYDSRFIFRKRLEKGNWKLSRQRVDVVSLFYTYNQFYGYGSVNITKWISFFLDNWSVRHDL